MSKNEPKGVSEVSEGEQTFITLLADLSRDVKDLEDIALALAGVRTAHEYIYNGTKSAKLLQILLNLQTTHSIIMGMHPESLYSDEKRTSATYEKIIEISENNSKFIEVALDVYQYLTSPAVTAPFLINREYCYNLLNSPLEGTQWSFRGLIFRILSNSKMLLSFQESLKTFAFVKGVISTEKDKGTATGLPPPREPPSEKGVL